MHTFLGVKLNIVCNDFWLLIAVSSVATRLTHETWLEFKYFVLQGDQKAIDLVAFQSVRVGRLQGFQSHLNMRVEEVFELYESICSYRHL